MFFIFIQVLLNFFRPCRLMKFLLSLRIVVSAPQRVDIPFLMLFNLKAAFPFHIFAVDPMLVSKFEKQLSDPTLSSLLVYVTISISH